MMKSDTPKTVTVDIFEFEEDKVEEFIADRNFCEAEVRKVMEPYCTKVVRETLDPSEGEAMVGYFHTGEVLMTVVLDPFEVPVMKIAHARGKLKEYVLAANNLTEEILEELLKETLS